jgi:hypothetical protein
MMADKVYDIDKEDKRLQAVADRRHKELKGPLSAQEKKATSLIRLVNKELDGIPQRSQIKNVKMGGDSLMRTFEAVGVAINDGLRAIKGEPSSKSLIAKRDRLMRYLKTARQLQSQNRGTFGGVAVENEARAAREEKRRKDD